MPFTQPQLTSFLSALSIDSGHLGLVVTSGDPLTSNLPPLEVEMEIVDVGADLDPDVVLEVLLRCARQRRWCRLNLLDAEFPPKVYNQLRLLSTTGHLDIYQMGVEGETAEFSWPTEAKVIVVAEANTLEEITIPTFLGLFGPIVRDV